MMYMVENNEVQNQPSESGEVPEKVINTTFFNRMFAWKKISAQNENSMEKLNAKISELETSCSKIHEELSVEIEGNKQQVEKYNELKDDFVKTTTNLTDVEKQLAVEKEKNSNLNIKVSDLNKKISAIEQKYDDVSRQLKEEQEKFQNERDHSMNLTNEVADKVSEISNLNTKVSDVEQKYDDVSRQLKEEQEKFQNEQERSTNLTNEVAEKGLEISNLSEQISAFQNEKTERESLLLKTWQEHVNHVAEKLDSYANKYNYIKISTEDYQYAGSPQNIFQFCKQYTIFDAISPKSLDDLKNFQDEVKEYAEEMKKYYKTELLRADAYLVVPTSAIPELDSTSYYFPGYTVHVITPETLLPILTMLATLETYDFANQISEEGRDKICSLLARLSYIAKKKVQTDTIYSKDLISTLREIKTLPSQYTSAIASYEERKNLLEFDTLSSNVDRIEHDYIGYTLEESKDNENEKDA